MRRWMYHADGQVAHITVPSVQRCDLSFTKLKLSVWWYRKLLLVREGLSHLGCIKMLVKMAVRFEERLPSVCGRQTSSESMQIPDRLSTLQRPTTEFFTAACKTLDRLAL
ncbi:hypothetical protein PAXRUDRAFT_21696 [Paxillus rubicundulus Ve08.2h10]|uniref:Uncharacterized protein n=1 Tax=Paxillus rubicundulus Ve08.2h10 TaxID=930991 RepID=A0A0D0CPE9_9AGAM|nr:hypothetical protein PAXRUDRAFT_21696 [Paxillus rubicundulus Ve08.2h10]